MLRTRSTFTILITSLLLVLSGCSWGNNNSSEEGNQNGRKGIPIKYLAGSDLERFCQQAADKLNATNPKLDNGQDFYLTCETKGSGDVVADIISFSQQLSSGGLQPDAAEFPTLISVDGEIYQSQLIYQVDKVFPGQNYIPPVTDSELLVYSPMVFMTTSDLAPALEKAPDLYTVLQKYNNYQQLDSTVNPLPIYFVQTAPTRSNSGLQTLVAQFASVANKQPQDLTIADINKYQNQVREIQSKVTRYGTSTGSLAQSMIQNGPFWASVGSVYESLVINANTQNTNNQTQYKAVYPKATFSSNIRAIIPNAPWVSSEEKEAAQKVVEFMRTPEIQKIAVDLGLRPGVPGIALGNKFSPEFGVNPNPTYESYRPPQPEVVEAMLESWRVYAKKPSLVAIVIDTSGSMRGNKLSSVQNTLFNYVNNLGPREQIALIAFSNEIGEPVIVKGTPEGKSKGIEYIGKLEAGGGTRLYDSALFASNWLKQNRQANAINAVLILTDGEDSGSQVSLPNLEQKLQQTGFNSDERIAFFTVGYGREGEFNPEILQKIAQINGGYYKKGDTATIAKVMENLQLEF